MNTRLNAAVDYVGAEEIFIIEPMMPEDVAVHQESVTIEQTSSGGALDLWHTSESEPAYFIYKNTLNVENSGDACDVDIVVPLCPGLDYLPFEKVKLKLNSISQTPDVSYSSLLNLNPSFINYTTYYNNRVSAMNVPNDVVGYYYEFTPTNDEEAYIEFSIAANSTRILSSDYLERTNWTDKNIIHFKYWASEEPSSLILMDCPLSTYTLENVTMTQKQITFSEFFHKVFDVGEREEAQGLVRILLDQLRLDYYHYTYDDLHAKSTMVSSLVFFSYSIHLPAGQSEIKISYPLYYSFLLDDNKVYATIVPKSNSNGNLVEQYEFSYKIGNPFQYFDSTDFEESEVTGIYKAKSTDYPSYNLHFLISQEEELETADAPDLYFIMFVLGIAMLPIVIFIGVIVLVIVAIKKKSKPKTHY